MEWELILCGKIMIFEQHISNFQDIDGLSRKFNNSYCLRP